MNQPQTTLRSLSRSSWFGLGLLGFAVRLIFLWDSQADPSFFYPLVDAKTYHDLAREFLALGMQDKFLWQSIFYPSFLAAIYKLFGVSIIAVKVTQALVGGLACGLTVRLGEVMFGRRTGQLAGLILVFYGPVVFFESRLLATGWATLFTVLIALVLVCCVSRPTKKSLFFLGLIIALATYTRPTFLPVGAMVVVALLVPRLAPDLGPRNRLKLRLMRSGFVLCGFALVVAPVSLYCKSTTGHWGLIPPSGGINFFIGNNDNYSETINIRPGLAWAALVAEPQLHGYEANPWSGNGYFQRETWRFIRTEPGSFATGLGVKALTLLSSREIPRNIDLMLHRQWSKGLSLATWRWGKWGFPFGLIFPLAMVGLVRARGRQVSVVKVLLAVLAGALVLVFVSSRYRAPLIPLLAVFAAYGGLEIIADWRKGRKRELGQGLTIAVVGLLLCTVPGPFAQESTDLRAELFFGVAEGLYDQERWQEASEVMAQSLALDSEVHAAHQIMGISLANRQKFDEAVVHFQEAVRLRPGHEATQAHLVQCQQDRARAHFLAGRELELLDPKGAMAEFEIARSAMPRWYKPIARQAYVMSTSSAEEVRDGARALDLARRAVELRGADDPYLQMVLAAALAENGEFEAAVLAAERSLQGQNEEAEIIATQKAIVVLKSRQPLRR